MDQPYEFAGDGAGNHLSRYVLKTVRKDDEFALYRGRSDADLAPILVVEPPSEYTSPATIRKLEHAYSLGSNCMPTGRAGLSKPDQRRRGGRLRKDAYAGPSAAVLAPLFVLTLWQAGEKTGPRL